MADVKGQVFMKKVDGFPFPIRFPEDKYYLMRNLPLRPDDVILSVYPKCGTHWVSYLVWSILHPEQDPPEGNRVREELPIVEIAGLCSWADSPENQSRTLSTHLPSTRLPIDARSKYVVVARNPFDCCVSYYKFLQLVIPDFETSKQDKIPDFYLEAFLTGEVPFGDYFSFYRDWYERRNDENVHFVTYEHMKRDPKGETLKLANFLGVSEKLQADAGLLLDKVVHQSSFDFMKRNVSYTQQNEKGEVSSSPIIRAGQVGSFRDSLSDHQVQRLRDKMEETLAGTELLQQWRHL